MHSFPTKTLLLSVGVALVALGIAYGLSPSFRGNIDITGAVLQGEEKILTPEDKQQVLEHLSESTAAESKPIPLPPGKPLKIENGQADPDDADAQAKLNILKSLGKK